MTRKIIKHITSYPAAIIFKLILVLFFVSVFIFSSHPALWQKFTSLFSAEEAQASHWFNTNYRLRRLITINQAQMAGTADLTNFPLLVSFNLPQDTDCGVLVDTGPCSANGFDIIFTDASHTPVQLDHQIERYVPGTGEMVMWVRISPLSQTVDTQIYIYYGNPSITATQESACGIPLQAGACVWDANFAGVWHLSETGTEAGAFVDSSTNTNNGQGGGGTATAAPAQVAGRIGLAQNFDGIDDFITAPDHATLDLTAQVTISAWVRPTDLLSLFNDVVVKGGNAADWNYSLEGNTNGAAPGGSNVEFAFATNSNWQEYRSNGPAALTANTWYHVATTFVDNGVDNSIDIYINGVPQIEFEEFGSPLTTNLTTNTVPLRIGLAIVGEEFNGIIDEARVSNAVRANAGDIIAAEFANGNNPGTPSVPGFYTVGIQEVLVSNNLPTIPTLAETPAFANQNTNQGGRPVLGTFSSTDAELNPIQYEIEWSTDITFPVGPSTITRNSVNFPGDAGWTAATFASAANVSYTIQLADALANGTYWWHVRARDPAGSNTFSDFSAPRSFTIDTALTLDQWMQTTSDQFTTSLSAPANTLTDTEATVPAGGVRLRGW
jgi:hypothetical protein